MSRYRLLSSAALRDFAPAMTAFFDPHDPNGRPAGRKAGRREGFRIVAVKPAQVRRLSRNTGQVRVPKAGWMRFRWSRAVPNGVKSCRVTRDPALSREILRSGWGVLMRRLADKAPGRVEKITPAYTSQRCSACRHVDAESRKSQPRFACTACGFAGHADVNAAINIAAGHPTRLPIPLHARGGCRDAGPVNREPQLLLPSA